MENNLVQLFTDYPNLAIVISIALSVLIAILGLVPSVFITGANILFFGFWQGTLISFVGEVIGAAISFWLYRKGFRKKSQKGLERFPGVKQLLQAEGSNAFYLILSLRLIPFVPSGVVTFAAAIGKVPALIFLCASSVGKAPALLMEAYAVFEITEFQWQGKLILSIIACFLLYLVLKKKS